MLKFVGFALLAAPLMLFQPVAAASTLSVSNWQTSGSQMWHINFPGGASELYYPQSGNYGVINYETALSPHHKINMEIGTERAFTLGTGTDSDWDYTQSNQLSNYGEFQTSGNSTFINLDSKHTLNSHTEFFYGYGYSNSQYVMSQGHYAITDYNQVSTALANLHSTYALVYHGPHVGITSTKQLAPRLALVGSLSYSPLSLVQGHGWWNLRNLDFQHLGTGQMLDGKIGLRYQVAGRRDNLLTAGYRYQHYTLYSGTESTSDQITWTKADKVQQGWYVGGEFSL